MFGAPFAAFGFGTRFFVLRDTGMLLGIAVAFLDLLRRTVLWLTLELPGRLAAGTSSTHDGSPFWLSSRAHTLLEAKKRSALFTS
jgi:hypothetical protein